MDDRVKVTDRLYEIGFDTRFSAEYVGNFVRANLFDILSELRSTGTGRSEAEAMREAVENALTEWTRPSAIRLMIGEMTTRQEGRTANAVAAAVASKVRAALNPPAREGEGA